jgi:hypothetical protein
VPEAGSHTFSAQGTPQNLQKQDVFLSCLIVLEFRADKIYQTTPKTKQSHYEKFAKLIVAQ